MAAVRDGTALRLHIDGVQKAVTTTGNDSLTTANFQSLSRTDMGQVNGNSTRRFDGLLDDVGVWSRPLEGREIAAIAGLGYFVGIDLANSAMDDILTLSGAGQWAMAGGEKWFYTTGLSGVQGSRGGSILDGDAFIVLGADGSGVTLVPEPAAAMLAIMALLSLGMFRRRRR